MNTELLAGELAEDWAKMPANRETRIATGGYMPSSSTFDLIPVGYYKGGDVTSAGSWEWIRPGHATASVRASSRYGIGEASICAPT